LWALEARQAFLARTENRASLESMAAQVVLGLLDLRASVARMAIRGWQVLLGQRGQTGRMGPWVARETQGRRACRVHRG